jgi:hypothetical protein
MCLYEPISDNCFAVDTTLWDLQMHDQGIVQLLFLLLLLPLR